MGLIYDLHNAYLYSKYKNFIDNQKLSVELPDTLRRYKYKINRLIKEMEILRHSKKHFKSELKYFDGKSYGLLCYLLCDDNRVIWYIKKAIHDKDHYVKITKEGRLHKIWVSLNPKTHYEKK